MWSSLDQASKQEDNCGCIGLRSVDRWWWREASDERSSIIWWAGSWWLEMGMKKLGNVEAIEQG